ncbi:MAG: hypothetical protein ACLT9P_01495 [Evtepia gabavorous]
MTKKVLNRSKLNKAAEMGVGDEIKGGCTFAKGDHIDVTGISKGDQGCRIISAGTRASDDTAAGCTAMQAPWARYRSFPDL